MRKIKQFTWAALAVAGLLAGSAGRAPAGEPGIVRITDSGSAAASTQTQALPDSTQQLGDPQPIDSHCGEGGCHYEDYGDDSFGKYDRNGYRRHRLCDLLLPPNLGANSPDHNWGRPVKRPINRLPVLYQRYWPTYWHGHPQAGFYGAGTAYYPMIYTPTDTTQLGFYYQRVPFWRPNPAMTPPVPWPANWHLRECGARPFGHDYSNASGYPYPAAGGVNGARSDGAAGAQPPGESESAPNLSPAPPADAPDQHEDAPPVPREVNRSAQNR